MHFFFCFALGSFINWYNDQLVYHIFSWQEDNEMVPRALIYYLYSDPGEQYQSVSKKGYLDVGLFPA